MNMDDPETSAREDDASRIAARAGDLRRAILQHPDGTRPATAGEVAAALALVYAATGRTPFCSPGDPPATVVARLRSERIDVDAAMPWAPAGLRRTLQRALSRDPSRRPSMAELVRALPDPGSNPPEADRPRPTQRWVVGLATALVVGLAGTVLVAARWEGERRTAPPPDLCRSFRESID